MGKIHLQRFPRTVRWGLAIALLAVVGSLFAPVSSLQKPAFAYDGNGAAWYADTWAFGANSNYYVYDSDCANFVSQALHDPSGGNFHYVGNPSTSNTTDDHQWWMHYDWFWGFSWSSSFVRANDLYTFLMWDYPGGWPEGSAHTLSEQQATYTPDSVVTGDVLFYDLDGNGSMDHTGIQVGWGWDPDKHWYGNYQDQHTTNRRHAFWSLLPYNGQWPSTRIYFVHVDANNW